MIKRLQLSRSFRYWIAGTMFLVVDLVRAGASGRMPFVDGPVAMPEAFIYLGLRAATDLMILGGIWLIYSQVCADLQETGREHGSESQPAAFVPRANRPLQSAAIVRASQEQRASSERDYRRM